MFWNTIFESLPWSSVFSCYLMPDNLLPWAMERFLHWIQQTFDSCSCSDRFCAKLPLTPFRKDKTWSSLAEHLEFLMGHDCDSTVVVSIQKGHYNYKFVKTVIFTIIYYYYYFFLSYFCVLRMQLSSYTSTVYLIKIYRKKSSLDTRVACRAI